MKELEYPFDGGSIQKKKRSLRRTLLEDGRPRINKKIALLAGSTANEIKDMLELFLLDSGIQPEFYLSEYDRWWQDAVFENKELDEFSPDIVFIHTTSRNITAFPDISADKAEADKLLDAELEKFNTAWEAIKRKYRCPIIQNNFELPYFRIMGNRDVFDRRGRVNFINRLNTAFAEHAEKNDGFYINDINYLSACYGLDKWSDPLYWYMYKYALCVPAIPEFAYNLASIIRSVYGKNRKALVLDLDNTLWGGVIGDDGPEGIEIGHETNLGQMYSEFQGYLKLVKNSGVMLTVCSKNEEENALAGLDHPSGTLRPEDFVMIVANWESKDRNVAAIAKGLNIGEDALVFVDDNPAERAIVAAQIPTAAVPDIGDPESYIRVLDRSRFFEITAFSDDDLKRNEMYRQNAERAAQQSKFSDYGEYLDSLEMVAVIDDFLPIYIPRITQLTNKSNQFNLTTRRFTEDEMRTVYGDDGYIRLYGSLSDKFGDNGIVSVVIGKQEGGRLDIILWLMSCRVLKREMEFAMLDRLVEEAKRRKVEEIRGHYFPTKKNAMVKGLYGSFGFERISCDADGNTEWRLLTDGYVPHSSHIRIERNE